MRSVALGIVVLFAPTTRAALLSPNTISASSTAAGFQVNSLINGSGLFRNLHSSLVSDMWLADNVNPGSDLPYGSVNAGFASDTWVRSLKIWNFNSGDLTRGAKRVEIRYNSGGFNISAGIYTLSQGTGGALGGQIIVLPVDVLASSIQIVFLDNYGNESYVGLSEIQFYSEDLLASLEPEFLVGDGGNDSNGTGPNGTGPNGTGPNGTGPTGTGPTGTGPTGTGPNGTVPTGTTPTNVEEIPEPATWVMIGAGVLLLGWKKRRAA